MYHYNSTIKIKTGICLKCGGTNKVPLTKGLCQMHYREQMNRKSIDKGIARQLDELDPVKILIADYDFIFSQLVRLTAADENGMVKCYTCDAIGYWKYMQCGHFIQRDQMPTRFSLKNCRCQCGACNIELRGNLVVFAERLEAEEPGLVAILEEQARGVQDYGRDELKALIQDASRKVKPLIKLYQ
jgi:hypothetical protein